MNKLLQLFETYTGKKPDSCTELQASGSNRKYFRLQDKNHSIIGVSGTSFEENKAFIQLAKLFKSSGLSVPHIYAVSDDGMTYIQEDLGELDLFDAIKQGRKSGKFTEEEKQLLKKTIERLPDFQFKGAHNLDFSICFPQKAFDKRTVLWDLNYFKYCFLKNTGIEFREDLLEDDFELLSCILLKNPSDTFMYRDFQSRNVMIKDEEPFFIDFQGGRKGPFYYDIASFLWQAKAQYPEALKKELMEAYLRSLKKYIQIEDTEFYSQLKYFILFRVLQVLGAYGFRGYIEKKSHFIESIPYAIINLKNILQSGFTEFPYLNRLLTELSTLEKFQAEKYPEKNGLTINIYSFAYSKGIPEDTSGNGGGYVFDCRGIHNPGRYEEYKQLTGLDKPVIDFLEKDGEITAFIEKIYELANKHIRCYLDRNFTNLMFCFGCTGGQHRSVYAAQHLAEYLANKFPVKVYLEHREQGIKKQIK